MKDRKKLLIDLFSREDYIPIRLRDIANIFYVPKKDREELQRLLNELIREGKIERGDDGRYHKSIDTISGVFMKIKSGAGFVSFGKSEIYIPKEYTLNAFNKDVVTVVKIEKETGKRRTGKIVGIQERHLVNVVGKFIRNDNFGFVIPDNRDFDRDIYIKKQDCKGVKDKSKVVVEILDYGSDKKKPEGRVIEVLGMEEDRGVDIISIAKSYGLRCEFEDELLSEANRIEEVSEKEILKRLDLRNEKIITIDGEDSKDLDDAISVSKILKSDGSYVYNLGVHIADVSHYVKFNSRLDKEALLRGNSTYLIDKVIPMLPARLSNGICSLNEGECRLTLSVIMEIDSNGVVLSHKIVETVIQTTHRMTYSDVNRIMTGEDDYELKKRYSDVYDLIAVASELSKILRKRRRMRGAIDFDFAETKILLEEDGSVKEVIAYDRNEATRLIEDFMLVANETVAEDSYWQGLPFIYRNHEEPTQEKIKEFTTLLKNLGYKLSKKRITKLRPKEIQELLEEISGTENETLIKRIALQSLKRANYQRNCEGHFGLATKYYCHFTSPIRRYPDLQIHRIIKENLSGGLSDKKIEYYEKRLPEIARQSSLSERRSDEVEREVDKMKASEYMKGKIGQEFNGIISGVTKFGIYVELESTIEGMVRLDSIGDDFYIFDEQSLSAVGELTNKRYKLGQEVRVKVINANKEQRTVDFKLLT